MPASSAPAPPPTQPSTFRTYASLGIGAFVTAPTEVLPGAIKAAPEDFVVTEIGPDGAAAHVEREEAAKPLPPPPASKPDVKKT